MSQSVFAVSHGLVVQHLSVRLNLLGGSGIVEGEGAVTNQKLVGALGALVLLLGRLIL